MTTITPEIWFYHLERSSLDRVLPDLVEKTLARGWRAVIRVGSDERLEQLDALLWTSKDDAFLAHGRSDEPHAARQPVLLTQDMALTNAPDVLFAVDGVALGALDTLKRVIVIFDGNTSDAVGKARETWKVLKTQGLPLSYWQEQLEGGWKKTAST